MKDKAYKCKISHEKNKDKKGYLIRTESLYCFDEDYVLHETVKYRLNISKIFMIISLLILVVLLVSFGINLVSAKILKSEESEVNMEIQENKAEKDLTELIFDQCSSTYLKEEEVYKLYVERESFCTQVQFYINLMYARHGQVFKKGGNSDAYFQEQDWYQGLNKKEVTYEELNDFERQNVNLLVSILEKEGYR